MNKKYVQELPIIVYRKKRAHINWVINHLLQKQLEKAQYKSRRNLKFMFLRETFITEH